MSHEHMTACHITLERVNNRRIEMVNSFKNVVTQNKIPDKRNTFYSSEKSP